jgi:predicted nucleic acid-binding protein
VTVFLDANIIFSGSNSGSNMHRFLLWLSDKEKLVTSVYAASEAERNILAKRESWHNEHLFLMQHIEKVPDKRLVIDLDLAEKDKPILGSAIAAGCEYLVTGDKRDFGHLFDKTIEGVTVISYITLARLMLKRHK